MSVISPPAILGPEMAPILWAPGIFWFFLLENPVPTKLLLLGGRVLGFFSRGGGWKCQFYFFDPENFERHWSILISGNIHMNHSLVHTFSWGSSYGPMVLKVLLKFPPHWYWSMDGSSQFRSLRSEALVFIGVIIRGGTVTGGVRVWIHIRYASKPFLIRIRFPF